MTDTTAPTYAATHSALHRRRGPANRRACIVCGRRAQEWACYPCDGADVIEGRNAEGRRVTYTPDLDGYAPLCRTHHREHDRARAIRSAATAHLALTPLPLKRATQRSAVLPTPDAPPALFDLDPTGPDA